jgi:16S rRNA (cytosine967-C5)-methyltransferase
MDAKARFIAWKCLAEWDKTKDDPHAIIAANTPPVISPEDGAFARELLFGTIKFKRKIDYYSSRFIKSENLETKLKQVIRLGFYQLLQTTNIPPYAAVSETVEVAKQVCSSKQAGFVNAVLREYLRYPEKAELPDFKKDRIRHFGVKYSYPDWLVRRYLKRFGFEQAPEIFQWGNTAPELYFFVNRYIAAEKDVIDELAASDIQCQENSYFKGYYQCLNPSALLQSKSFLEGKIIIGDPGQGLAAKALTVKKGETVLDLFAAPGGKTASLAETAGSQGWVIGADNSLRRLQILKENVSRWRLNNALIIVADVLQFPAARNFKYVLADVPCSGTGTIRRNPDLRWQLKSVDIRRHSHRQLMLLEVIAGLTAPGGRIVYSTCSLEPEENTGVIENFLKQNEAFHLKNINGFDEFKIADGMYEVSGYKYQTDGAFIAVIERD